MKPLLTPDAKEGSASSTDHQDVTPPQEGVESSTTTTETDPDTLENAVQAAIDKSDSPPDPATEQEEESGPEVGQDAKNKEEKKSEEEEVVSKDKTPTDKEKATDDPPPFHEHPRWKEMVTERDTLRGERESLQTQLQGMQGVVEAHKSVVDYCEKSGVTREQYQAAVEMAALLNTNPAEAWKRLKPIVENLSRMTGDSIPQDLENEVAEGTLSMERAKELAQLRGHKALEGNRQQLTAQQHQEQLVQATQNALGSWEKQTFRSDPDFHPKANKDAADGKYELLVDRVTAAFSRTPPRNPQEAVAVTQAAYESISRAVSGFVPKPPPRKALSSQRTTASRTEQEPETMEDAVNGALRKHGY